jgi:two-component system osmolarity sensor histidine kinase EnvZ
MLGLGKGGTLFARTAATISVVSIAFLIFVLGTLLMLVLIPIANRATHEIASLVNLSAHTWRDLPPERQAPFAAELSEHHGLLIAPAPPDLAEVQRHLLFMMLLEESLSQFADSPVEILQSNRPGEQDHYWIRLPELPPPYMVRVTYWHDGPEALASFALILLVGLASILLTAVILARRLTKPLHQLSDATRHVGCGERIAPLPETGPAELAELVRSFNEMAQQIQDLLANRTTLLAGISHDLRSPLTRIELALEMLEDEDNARLVGGVRRDVHQMNRLIGLFMEISKGLQEERRRKTDVIPLVQEVVVDCRRSGVEIQWRAGAERCERLIHPLALGRIVNNLVENAIRYGEGKPIRVACDVDEAGTLRIVVEDQGPGIPEAERDKVFQPFYRLEGSRSTATGGSGLGLSIVRQLAQANGCRVELLPADGGGTRAVITLP